MINYHPHLNRYRHFIVSRWIKKGRERGNVLAFSLPQPLHYPLALHTPSVFVDQWRIGVVGIKKSVVDANYFTTIDEWMLSGGFRSGYLSYPKRKPFPCVTAFIIVLPCILHAQQCPQLSSSIMEYFVMFYPNFWHFSSIIINSLPTINISFSEFFERSLNL